MSALKHIFSGRAAVAVAAGVSTAASSSTAQARAPVQAAPHHEVGSKRLDEEWLVTYHGHQGDVILFKPFQACEIEDAFADVAKVVSRSKRAPARDPLIPARPELHDGDGHSGASTPTSDGSNANSEIMRTCLTGSAMYGSGWAEDPHRAEPSIDMMTLLELTNKMLKRPGMQVEIVKAMMDDPEIRNILLREGQDVDSYLVAAGASPAVSLLPPSVMAGLEQDAAAAAAGGGAEHDGGNVFANMVQAMLSALGHTGSGVGRLLNWLRSRFSLLLPRQAADFQQPGVGEAGEESAGKPQPGIPVFWHRVLTIATVVAVMVIFKRPLASFVRLGAVRVGVAGATLGTAAWAGAAAAAGSKEEAEEEEAAAPDAAAAADDRCKEAEA